MPLGLRNAAQKTFYRIIHNITRDLYFVHVYIDDLLVASSNLDKPYNYLPLLFQGLTENGIMINRNKVQLGRFELVFLGHKITHEGFPPCDVRVGAIQVYISTSSG